MRKSVPQRRRGSSMRLQRVLVTTFAALLLVGTAVLGASLVRRGVRLQQADPAEGHRRPRRVDQPAHLDPHRRQRADGKTEEWMIEGGTPNTLLRRGLTKNVACPRAPKSRRRLPREERLQPRQRPRRDVPRRPQALHGIVGHRRAPGREGRDREVVLRLRIPNGARVFGAAASLAYIRRPGR